MFKTDFSMQNLKSSVKIIYLAQYSAKLLFSVGNTVQMDN